MGSPGSPTCWPTQRILDHMSQFYSIYIHTHTYPIDSDPLVNPNIGGRGDLFLLAFDGHCFLFPMLLPSAAIPSGSGSRVRPSCALLLTGLNSVPQGFTCNVYLIF